MTRLLVIGSVWPEPASSAAGAHLLQVLRPFLQQGWDVTFASTAADSEFATDLGSLGISGVRVTSNDSGFDALLRSLRPEVVIFDRFFIEEQFGWRVEEQCPDALRILNSEDLHFLRDARERAHRQGEDIEQADLKNALARREIAAILRSDLTLIISSHEMQVLERPFGIDPALLWHVPFLIDLPSAADRASLPNFEARHDFLYVGNFRHAPNWDGVQWLAAEIWPRIRERLPAAELHVAGAYASRDQMSLHDPDRGFMMQGRIADADLRFRQARICLAPLRFGAGLKGKLVDAMRNGTPTVTTPMGAEGLSGGLAWGGAIEACPDSIAEAAVRIYESPTEWQRAQANGFKILGAGFDRRQHEPGLMDQIQLARDQLEVRRKRNFMGAMLRDHHHRSTRYLSLWIEAKNKRS